MVCTVLLMVKKFVVVYVNLILCKRIIGLSKPMILWKVLVMLIKEQKNKVYMSLGICMSIYFFVSAIFVKILMVNNLWIKKTDITMKNIEKAIFNQSIFSIIIPILCFLPFWKNYKLLKRDKVKYHLIFVTFAFYIISFCMQENITFIMRYNFIKYLFFIALGEEIIFRGIMYNVIKQVSSRNATLISGACFGLMHVLSIYWYGGSTSAILMWVVSELVGGILAGGYFIFLYEISGTIFLPVLIHAILDYPYEKQFTGMCFAIILTIYILVLHYISIIMEKIRKRKNDGI